MNDTLQLKISAGNYKRFQCTLESWDLGVPIGDGNTINEAIEEFIDLWEMKHNETPKFKWS